MNFDFDELSRLAKADPEMFELTRQQLIHAEIAKAPEAHQRGLLELQRELDAKRKTMDSAQFINHCMSRVNENLRISRTSGDVLERLLQSFNEFCACSSVDRAPAF